MNRTTVSKEELEAVFRGTNFGTSTPEFIVKWGLMKTACGYACGYTATQIMIELGLITPKLHNLTKRGQFCLFEYFRDAYTEEKDK